MSHAERLAVLCNRLTALGYAQHKKIRLYGEELELIANASPDGEGFAIEGIARTTGKLTRMRIPLTVVQTLRRELDVEELSRVA
jgi:hypothetical protein